MRSPLTLLIGVLVTWIGLSGCQSRTLTAPGAVDAPSTAKMLTCGLNPDEYNRLMMMEYKPFDTDVFGGWRVIDYRDGCSDVAAWVITDYIDRSRTPELTDAQLRLLNWHAGQTIAKTDERKALSFFQRSYEDKYAEPLSDWDLYVVGTIAFINDDKPGLVSAFDTLAQRPVSSEEQKRRQAYIDANPNIIAPPGFVAEPTNLPALRGLIECFGMPYRIAYGGKCLDEND